MLSVKSSSILGFPFGVQLTVQPRLDPSSGLIVVTIDAEQSQLSPIAGMVSFYNEKVDIVLDGRQLERPKTHFFH